MRCTTSSRSTKGRRRLHADAPEMVPAEAPGGLGRISRSRDIEAAKAKAESLGANDVVEGRWRPVTSGASACSSIRRGRRSRSIQLNEPDVSRPRLVERGRRDAVWYPRSSFGGVAQSGRALRSHRRSRGFKSHHLHFRKVLGPITFVARGLGSPTRPRRERCADRPSRGQRAARVPTSPGMGAPAGGAGCRRRGVARSWVGDRAPSAGKVTRGEPRPAHPGESTIRVGGRAIERHRSDDPESGCSTRRSAGSIRRADRRTARRSDRADRNRPAAARSRRSVHQFAHLDTRG